MIIGLIPSRLNSSRLTEKPLLEIDGLPLIVHTFKRAQLSKFLDRVIVCTDSKKILKIVTKKIKINLILSFLQQKLKILVLKTWLK